MLARDYESKSADKGVPKLVGGDIKQDGQDTEMKAYKTQGGDWIL